MFTLGRQLSAGNKLFLGVFPQSALHRVSDNLDVWDKRDDSNCLVRTVEAFNLQPPYFEPRFHTLKVIQKPWALVSKQI